MLAIVSAASVLVPTAPRVYAFIVFGTGAAVGLSDIGR
jgi:hypothetical protein